jgi:hypothetical protein
MSSACQDFWRARFHRRHLLQVGGAALGGLGLPSLLKAAAKSKPRRLEPRAQAVIFLHQFGGPSQLETFDPKPQAPEAIRGEFGAIPTSVPGVYISDQLPRLARLVDRLTILRCMQHHMKNHNSATYYSLTGHAPPVDDIRLRDSLELFPAYGSVVDRLAPAPAGVPTFVAYPYQLRDGSITPGQHASFLGKQHDPLFFTSDPNDPNFRLPELTLPAGISLERLSHRRSLLRLIDRQVGLLEHSALAQGVDQYYEKAVAILSSPQVRKAFDLSQEPPNVRDRYGRTTYGQSCLLARRLVEARVKFINVYFSGSIGGARGGWDTHGLNGEQMYPILRQHLCPVTDEAFSALIEDLDQRGLLERTLVVWMGEFGRTPKINQLGGRDHWPQCYCAVLAGGGVKRGYVYGASDRWAAYPEGDPVRPEDLAATMFYLLGIDPQTELQDSLGRPIPVSYGQPVYALLA